MFLAEAKLHRGLIPIQRYRPWQLSVVYLCTKLVGAVVAAALTVPFKEDQLTVPRETKGKDGVPEIHVSRYGGVWVDARELLRSPNARAQITKLSEVLGHVPNSDSKDKNVGKKSQAKGS